MDKKGGMMQSKLYFDVSPLNVSNEQELAEALKTKVWSDLR